MRTTRIDRYRYIIVSANKVSLYDGVEFLGTEVFDSTEKRASYVKALKKWGRKNKI